MIEYNRNDYNVDEIEDLAKISKLKTRADYRVYGLLEDKNPPVLIEFNFNLFNNIIGNYHRANLCRFFKYNGIRVRFTDDANTNKNLIWIGLRKDLRDDVQIATACVQTIVFYLEGKLNLEDSYKIPGIPSIRKIRRKKRKY